MAWPLIFWTLGYFLAQKFANRERDNIHTLLKSIDHHDHHDSISLSNSHQSFGFVPSLAPLHGEVEIARVPHRHSHGDNDMWGSSGSLLPPSGGQAMRFHPLLDSPRAHADAETHDVGSSVVTHEPSNLGGTPQEDENADSARRTPFQKSNTSEYVSLGVSRVSTGRRRRDSDSGFSDLKRS